MKTSAALLRMVAGLAPLALLVAACGSGSESISGAAVVVVGKNPVTSDADGRFSIPGVAVPYDLTLLRAAAIPRSSTRASRGPTVPLEAAAQLAFPVTAPSPSTQPRHSAGARAAEPGSISSRYARTTPTTRRISF